MESCPINHESTFDCVYAAGRSGSRLGGDSRDARFAMARTGSPLLPLVASNPCSPTQGLLGLPVLCTTSLPDYYLRGRCG